MRLILTLLALAAALCAQATVPRIGLIDFYGRRHVSEEKLRKALGVAEGDPLPKSKGDIEEKLEEVQNVVRARLEATCCAEGKVVLYVGIEEKGRPTFTYRNLPEGHMELPEAIVSTYGEFLKSVQEAVLKQQTGEDLTQGHSLMQHIETRLIQQRFIDLATKNEQILRDVLRNSESDEQRAIAAYVIGYSRNKAAVVNDLQNALQDPEDAVRNHAVRALTAIYVLSEKMPVDELRVSPAWFVEMLNSLIWTDRNNAAVALVTMTEKRDPKTLALLKERAMEGLVEMARWQHLPHALPSFILVGRIAGLQEEKIQEAWKTGDREKVITAALSASKKK